MSAAAFQDEIEPPPVSSISWFQWSRTSPDMLEYYERSMLRSLKVPYRITQVDIDADHHINTLETLGEHDSQKSPLVLIHGFGGGLGLYVKNIDDLSKHRKVYAIDTIGFGRSSRPAFDKQNADAAEAMFVEAIENWRKAQGIEKFVLLGHSFGGYHVGAYAQRYPERVSHLVFADPWGFPERPATDVMQSKPLWLRAAAKIATGVSPFALLRGLGPLGPSLIPKIRPDLPRKFDSHVTGDNVVASYIYHLNAQNPSGEHAFLAMSQMFGWAKTPFIQRIEHIDAKVPITFIYGRRTWMDISSGTIAQRLRPNSHVAVKVVPHAGHHVYADNSEQFNRDVIDAISAAP